MNDQKSIERTEDKFIAYCGIYCGKCQIYLAPTNPKIARELAKSFEGAWENVKPEDFNCSTCRGPIDECWSTECWIRDCCSKTKNLNYCFECVEFPCANLEKWSLKGKGYKKALMRLQKMKESSQKK
ncbi:MAG: DUF3795 domain-containing protein [Promethearchaeota archaeon]